MPSTSVFDTLSPGNEANMRQQNLPGSEATMQLNNPSTVTTVVKDHEPEAETIQTPVVTSNEDVEHLAGIKLYTLLLALALNILMMSLDASIMATAIPRITDDFHTIANVGWYGSAYMIANSCLQPLTGKVYKFFPLKLSYATFVALFEIGSILCATATSSTMLVIGRAVAGMGGSGLVNGSLMLIGVAAPPNQRPTIIGVIMSMFGFGQVLGPLIGGALTQHASWRWCFWINLPTGVAAVAGVFAVRLPPQDEKPELTRQNFLQNFDILGFVLFAPASIMLLLALQWGGIEYTWSSPTMIGLFVGSAVTYIIFAIWEKRQDEHALFPLSLLRRTIIFSSLLNTFFFSGALVLSYYLPLWFQVIKHATPTNSAVYILPTFIAQILFAIVSGPLTTRIGFFSPLSLFGCAIAAIGTGLMVTFTPTTHAGSWIGYQILVGVGRGLAFQQPINAVQAFVHKSQLSTGLAIIVWAQFFGGAVLLALAQTSFASLLKIALRVFAPSVNPVTVINAGATNYANVVAPSELNGVLLAYNQAITKTYYLPAITAAAAAIVSVGMGWKRVIGKDHAKKTGSEKGKVKDSETVGKAEGNAISVTEELKV